MKTAVFIDSCAWNYLFEHRIDLEEAFPRDEYSLALTREIELELAAIPDTGKDGTDKVALKVYITESIAKHSVKTTSVFGFATTEPDGRLSKVQVYGGFGQGTWQSDTDRRWYDSDNVKELLRGKPKRKSGLSDNQADASLAVRSFESIVLTNEAKTNNGPLRLATEQGGRIVYLVDVEQSGLSLREVVRSLKS